MSTSPSARPALLRGVPAQAGVGPARIDYDLRRAGLAEHGADPRLVDPGLELAFDEAVARGVEAGVRRGYARGHEAGLAAGLTEARSKAAALAEAQRLHEQARADRVARALGALADQADALRVQREQALELGAPVIIAAALELAELVLGHEPRASADPGAGALARALAAVPGTAADVTARLHPEDVAALADAPSSHDVRVVADPSVARGDCVVRAGDAEVDAQVRAALERVRRVIAP